MEGKYLVCDYLVVLLLLWHWVSIWWFMGVRAHINNFAKKINYAFNVHLLNLKNDSVCAIKSHASLLHVNGVFGWRKERMLFTYSTSLINIGRRWNEDEMVNCNFFAVCYWRLCSDIHIRIYYQRFHVKAKMKKILMSFNRKSNSLKYFSSRVCFEDGVSVNLGLRLYNLICVNIVFFKWSIKINVQA